MKLARRFITSREGFLRQIFSICKSFRRHPAQLIARRLGCLFIRLSKRLSSIICLYRDKFNLGQQDVSKMFQFVQTELANLYSQGQLQFTQISSSNSGNKNLEQDGRGDGMSREIWSRDRKRSRGRPSQPQMPNISRLI